MLSSAFSLNAGARQGTCKRSRFKSIGVSPANPRWLPEQQSIMHFVREYARNIFRFDFRNGDVCFFVWIYEMEEFKLRVGRSFALISNHLGGYDLFVTGRRHLFFLLSERLLSFNNVMVTLTRARWSAIECLLPEHKRSGRCLQVLAIQVDRCIARKSKMATKAIMVFHEGLCTQYYQIRLSE